MPEISLPISRLAERAKGDRHHAKGYTLDNAPQGSFAVGNDADIFRRLRSLGFFGKRMAKWVHLCIDLQRIFGEDTPWHVPWMRETSPHVEELSRRFPERTIFTRFITPERAQDMPGRWQAYSEKWGR
jgi:hypothetical protein